MKECLFLDANLVTHVGSGGGGGGLGKSLELSLLLDQERLMVRFLVNRHRDRKIKESHKKLIDYTYLYLRVFLIFNVDEMKLLNHCFEIIKQTSEML